MPEYFGKPPWLVDQGPENLENFYLTACRLHDLPELLSRAKVERTFSSKINPSYLVSTYGDD